jgi:ABC-type multidrug transport system ATPase subunit
MKSTVILKMTTMSFLLDLDRVIILENGNIKEHGRPNDLLTHQDTELFKEVKEVDPNVMKKFKKHVLLGKQRWADTTNKSSASNPFVNMILNSKRKKKDN